MASDRTKMCIFLLMGALLLWGTSSALAVDDHERAHYQSCLYFGGNGTIHYTMFPFGAEVICVGVPPEKEQLWNQTAGLQEAIGYPFNDVINAIYAAAAIVVAAIYLEGRK